MLRHRHLLLVPRRTDMGNIRAHTQDRNTIPISRRRLLVDRLHTTTLSSNSVPVAGETCNLENNPRNSLHNRLDNGHPLLLLPHSTSPDARNQPNNKNHRRSLPHIGLHNANTHNHRTHSPRQKQGQQILDIFQHRHTYDRHRRLTIQLRNRTQHIL